MTIGTALPRGSLTTTLIKGTHKASLIWRVGNVLRPSFLLGLIANKFAKVFSIFTGIPTITAELRAVKIDGQTGQRTDYGIVSFKVVTTAFVNFVVDQLQVETSVFGDFKFHDSGVGTTAENIANTAMETTDGESRVTGTQTESSANIYVSVGTIAYTTTKAITEHGLFNDATAGTLMDRSVFAAINVVNGDSVQFSYSLTIASGG